MDYILTSSLPIKLIPEKTVFITGAGISADDPANLPVGNPLTKLYLEHALGGYFDSFTKFWTEHFPGIEHFVHEGTWGDIRDGNKHITVEWLALIIIFLCMIFCCIFFRRIICSAEIEEGRMYQIINLKPLKWISSEYLLSYVIPLIAFDFTKWQDMAEFLVLWGFLFYLCLRYWQMPVAWLGVIGYYATECKLNTLDGQTIYKTIISKKPLVQMQGDSIFLNDIDNEHMIQTMNILKKEDYNY